MFYLCFCYNALVHVVENVQQTHIRTYPHTHTPQQCRTIHLTYQTYPVTLFVSNQLHFLKWCASFTLFRLRHVDV